GRYARLRDTIGRHPMDLLRLAIAAGVVLACLVVARTPGVNEVEAAIFHEFQRLPDWSARGWTVVSWAGFWPGIAAGAGLALYLGRVRMAVAVAWAGVIAWMLVITVHQLVGPRIVPTELLEGVRGPGPEGFLFPALGTAVIAAVITAAGPYVTRFEQYTSWVLVVAVGIADLYLGESLPIGSFAGAVLGWGVGILIHLVLGAPGRRTAEPSVQSALRRIGLAPVEVVCTRRQMLRPQLYDVTTEDGEILQVKVVRRLHRLAGPGHRLRRFLASLEVDPAPALTTPRHEVAHEAYITLLAERAGVGTLPVLLAGEIEHGPPFLVRRRVMGQRLTEMAPGAITDAHLDGVWRAVRDLGAMGITHHDLRAENLLVDDRGDIRITDFTFGRVGGPSVRNARDVAEMLVSLTSVVGVERAVDSAIRMVPDETLAESLPQLQSLALHRRFRNQLTGSAVLAQLREVFADRLGQEVPPFRSPVRPSTVAILAAGGLAVYLLLPELSSFADVRSVIAAAHWGWLAAGVVLGMLAVLASGLTILGSARPTLPAGRTMAVQLGAAFTGRTTVAAVGYYTIHLSFFERLGMPRTEAVGVLLLNRAATVVVTGAATIAGFFVIGNAVPVGELSIPWWLWVAAGGAALLAVAFLASPFGRARVWRPLRVMIRQLIATVIPTLRRPVRAIQLIVGEIGFLACSAAAVATTLSALGAHYALGAVIAVFIVGSTLGQLLPTPGGLGAVEGALVAGLTAIGIQPTDAVAATLVARVLTFWLPVLPGIVAFRLLQHHEVI
ncbi:MAG: lysylphosphatidylglycerol synthase domain-containing protein, partial [Micrococcales bacterium]|nr:lysylphosphatidylglycerol synthase domain-containing protein [Micrococcales bacterium]